MGTLQDVVFAQLRLDDEREVVRVRGAKGYVGLRARELGARVRRAARVLSETPGAGGRVAIVLANCPEWHLVDFAAALANVVTVPCHHYLAAQELAWILKSASVGAVVLDDGRRWHEIAADGEGLPGVTRVWALTNGAGCDDPRVRVFDELEQAEPLDDGAVVPARPEALATILYTSGTTGTPKGVRLSHGNLMASVRCCQERHPLAAGHVGLSLLPLSHIFERVVALVYIASGVVVAYSSPATISADLASARPHFFVGVPRVFEKVRARALGTSAHDGSSPRRRLVDRLTARGHRLLAHADDEPMMTWLADKLADGILGTPIRHKLGGRVELVITGGAAIEPDLVAFFAGIGVPLYEGYGLSETAAILTITPRGGVRGGSVGPACIGTEIRIACEGDETVGEIQVRGPQVFSGYENDEAATRAAFTADGWFCTGDLGTLDPDGYLRIQGRKKHVLVTSWGKKVTPAPLEAAFESSPLIERAIVVGEGRPYLGLLVEPSVPALVAAAAAAGIRGVSAASSPSELAARPEIVALVWREIETRQCDLSRPERVRAVRFLPRPLAIEDGTLTPTLKVRRHIVLERHADLVEEIYREEGVVT